MKEGGRLMLIDMFITSFAGSNQTWFIWEEPDQKATMKKLETAFANLQSRGEKVSISFSTRAFEVTVPASSVIIDRIRRIASDQTATRLASMLMRRVATVYVEERNREEAKRIAETAFAISASRISPDANNIGYLYLAIDDFEEARRWFQAARQYDVEGADEQLLEYNFGVLSALTGDEASAIRHFQAVRKFNDETDVSCVYRLYAEHDRFCHEEVFSPGSLAVLAGEAIEAMRNVGVSFAKVALEPS
jgi:tetratricopeptide (TPR) repeat protein